MGNDRARPGPKDDAAERLEENEGETIGGSRVRDQDPVTDTMSSHGAGGNDDFEGQGPDLPVAVQQHLGQQLKKLYGEMISEPLPDKFAKLLDELARKEDRS